MDVRVTSLPTFQECSQFTTCLGFSVDWLVRSSPDPYFEPWVWIRGTTSVTHTECAAQGGSANTTIQDNRDQQCSCDLKVQEREVLIETSRLQQAEDVIQLQYRWSQLLDKNCISSNLICYLWEIWSKEWRSLWRSWLGDVLLVSYSFKSVSFPFSFFCVFECFFFGCFSYAFTSHWGFVSTGALVPLSECCHNKWCAVPSSILF